MNHRQANQMRAEYNNARRRVDEIVLAEISTAFATGDHLFLQSIGVDLETAKLINALSNGTTKRLTVSIRSGIFTIQTDNEALKRSLQVINKDSDRERQLNDLLELGARKTTLEEMGFSSTVLPTSWKRGRTPTLNDREQLQCIQFWRTWRNPENVDPLDILIQTSRYLGFSIDVIWGFIGPSNDDMTHDKSAYSFRTPAHERPYVQCMFPDWRKDAESF